MEKECTLKVTTYVGERDNRLVENNHEFTVKMLTGGLREKGIYQINDVDYFRILSPVITDYMFYINYGLKNLNKDSNSVNLFSDWSLYENDIEILSPFQVISFRKDYDVSDSLNRENLYRKLCDIFDTMTVKENA